MVGENLRVHKKPATSVDDLSRRVFLKETTFTFLIACNFELAGSEEIDARDGAIANRDLSFLGLDVHLIEAVEILEKCSVWSSDSQFELC